MKMPNVKLQWLSYNFNLSYLRCHLFFQLNFYLHFYYNFFSFIFIFLFLFPFPFLFFKSNDMPQRFLELKLAQHFGFHPFRSQQLRCPSSWAIKETVASDQKCSILKYEHHFGFRWISVLGCCSPAAVVGVVQYLQPDGGDEENIAELNKTCDNRQATMSWLVASCNAAVADT